jgi:formylglycine-generating enzyme required for sulfatase activity
MLWLARAGGVVTGRTPDLPLLVPQDEEGRVGPLIQAPADPGQWPEWRRQLEVWRETTRRALSYDDALYRRPDLAWASRCYSCGFVMMCDEAFYDARSGRFTVDAFLESGEREFGGFDAIVLWHAYPRIGFDARNQFDFYRDMPGGLDGLRELSRRCHARGTRVFVNYNPWDTGTRREGQSDVDALADLVEAIEGDGIFLDTLHQGASAFRDRLDATGRGVVLESELALPVEGIADHHLSWAQWFNDSEAPGVVRNQWFERRHRTHQIRRWHRDHSDELHSAWMNGGGMLVWENVFGSWIGWNVRDQGILRAMLPIQRRYAELFAGENWTPLVPTQAPGVYASRWEARDLRLWTLSNRSNQPIEGPLLRVTAPPDARCFDLIAGAPADVRETNGAWTISGRIEARGIGCFMAISEEQIDSEFESFLSRQRRGAARTRLDTAFPDRTVTLRASMPAPRYASIPSGMIEIPSATVTLTVEFRSRECGFYESTPAADRVWGWAPLHEPRSFAREARLTRYAIDRTPVTNAEYARYIASSGYRPRDPENFLKHWLNGAPPPGLEEHPVVHVDLDDARAYAAWAGKRLPTEEEWQYAAAGPEQRLYPWGNQLREGVCNDGSGNGTTPVMAFPAGRSPCGAYDFCGNVWHWTESERTDGRTRFCIVKGGSWFEARGSAWYADGGVKPCNFAAKFLLMWPGLDRCATVGFRCVADLA